MPEPIVEMINVSKSFPGVKALQDVSLNLFPGEVHALVGENGAGKSTLIKILAGAQQADDGEILYKGQKVEYNRPDQALSLGIGAIYQEFNLVPELSVAENIVLGSEPSRGAGRLNHREMHRIARKALSQLGLDLDTEIKVRELRVAQQQIVEIAKGLVRELQVLIMDEPTAALNYYEIDRLFAVIKTLKERGIAILYISHRLREIFQVADTLTVLKDGKLVGTKSIQEVDENTVVNMMVGRELENIYPPKDTKTDVPVFTVKGLSLQNHLNNISFTLHKGEILGIAGLEGQGQRDLVRAITGDIRPDSGIIQRGDDPPVTIKSPQDAQKVGIGYIPDDRKGEGLVLIRSVQENIALPSLAQRTNRLLINTKDEKKFVDRMVDWLVIKVSDVSQLTRNLSGGNQQKVVIAKCLGTDPQVLVVSEPTRGIDVGSKSEIHHIMRKLAQSGVGILMVSSDLPEILGMSDRVLVMSQGEIVEELPGDTATEENIMAAATRVNAASKA